MPKTLPPYPKKKMAEGNKQQAPKVECLGGVCWGPELTGFICLRNIVFLLILYQYQQLRKIKIREVLILEYKNMFIISLIISIGFSYTYIHILFIDKSPFIAPSSLCILVRYRNVFKSSCRNL